MKSDYILKEDLNLPNQLKVVCQSESFISTKNMARIKIRVSSKWDPVEFDNPLDNKLNIIVHSSGVYLLNQIKSDDKWIRSVII